MAKNNKGLTRGQLIAAGREPNEEVVPEPPIDVMADDEELLKSQIMEAAGIMVPGEDEVSPETQHVINVLEGEEVVPTIDGRPQKQEEKPATTEPKEESKEGEDKTEDKEELVKLINAARRIKDLKETVEGNPTFKALKGKMAEGYYRVEGGIALLKKEMLEALGIGQKQEEKQKPVGKKASGRVKGGKKKTEKKKTEKKPAQKKEKKSGVITTIVQTIEDAGKDGVTKEEIFKVLKKQFPDREEKSMKNTINVQVPSRISKERFAIKKTDEGKYYKA